MRKTWKELGERNHNPNTLYGNIYVYMYLYMVPLGRTIFIHREGVFCRLHIQMTKIPTKNVQLDAALSRERNDFHSLQKKLKNVVFQ